PASLNSAKKSSGFGDPFRSEPYLTLKLGLRDMLMRVEAKKQPEKLLFSSASYLRAAVVRGKNPEDARKLAFRTRPMWDVVNILGAKADRIEHVGMSLLSKGVMSYSFRNSLASSDGNNLPLHHELVEHAA